MGEISPATVAFAPQRPPPSRPARYFPPLARASDRHGQALEAPPLRLPAPRCRVPILLTCCSRFGLGTIGLDATLGRTEACVGSRAVGHWLGAYSATLNRNSLELIRNTQCHIRNR